MAVLASEAPLARTAAELPADEALPPLAEQAHRRLSEAVAALPLSRAGYPYNAAALAADQRQDAPWHQVRMLVRLSRYARELIAPEAGDLLLAEAGRALEWHRDAAEAAAAAAAAARTPASPRPPPTPWACCTPTSGTRWRRPGSPSAGSGCRGHRTARAEEARDMNARTGRGRAGRVAP